MIRLNAVKSVVDLDYVGEIFVIDDTNIVYISEIPFYSGFPKDIVNKLFSMYCK